MSRHGELSRAVQGATRHCRRTRNSPDSSSTPKEGLCESQSSENATSAKTASRHRRPRACGSLFSEEEGEVEFRRAERIALQRQERFARGRVSFFSPGKTRDRPTAARGKNSSRGTEDIVAREACRPWLRVP